MSQATIASRTQRFLSQWPVPFAIALLGVAAGVLQILGWGWTGTGGAVAIGVPLLVLLHQSRELAGATAARRLLAAEVEALRDDAAAVAHDLRSPLVTVRSYIELVDQGSYGPLPIEARRALERAVDASSRAQSLVESTLRRHRARRTDEALNGRAVTQLDAVLRDVRIGLGSQLAAANARIEVDPLPAVLGDRDALMRVFQNLVENAIKHAAPGSTPRVRVSASVFGQRCEIEVRDWGTGIPLGDQERIFARYERGQRSEGSGIGLATVRQLIDDLSGQVWIDPDVTDGTSVRISLPTVTASAKLPIAA
ncbi:MAG: HAMP domain-containing sensor histidine kinase [Chloroflexi bacterium]|nr:HAMP domain-containing sensor histidine kinase [Chloroflexota bacterium]